MRRALLNRLSSLALLYLGGPVVIKYTWCTRVRAVYEIRLHIQVTQNKYVQIVLCVLCVLANCDYAKVLFSSCNDKCKAVRVLVLHAPGNGKDGVTVSDN